MKLAFDALTIADGLLGSRYTAVAVKNIEMHFVITSVDEEKELGSSSTRPKHGLKHFSVRNLCRLNEIPSKSVVLPTFIVY